ncbi:MAG: hypothetical protein ACKVP5_05150, partial [Aestuariivirga sp.]
ESEAMLKSSGSEHQFKVANGVADALALVTRVAFDAVIVDQGDEQNASALLIAMLASLKPLPRIVVIAQPAHVQKYLRLRGVRSVLTLPLKASHLIKATTLHEAKRRPPILPAPEAIAPEVSGSEEKPNGWMLGPSMLKAVSGLYKYSAFVLLSVLFSAFCFYGLMIVYFLVSDGWGAPVTLSKGHELVVKAEREISDLRVHLNLVGQRLSEAELEAAKAERAIEDARVLISYVANTIDQEVRTREAARKTVQANLKRIEKVKKAFDKSVESGALTGNLDELFAKRLINRKSYSSGTLGALEAEQRLAGLAGELDGARDEAANFESMIAMLKSLNAQLASDAPLSTITGSSADLVLLTKQAVDARSALDQSQVQLASAQSRQKLLGQSKALIEWQIGEQLATPLGRAITSRIDVVFVPYSNSHSFAPGTPLYSCSLSILLCHEAGKVGQPIPGEVNAVHPFFGKPIRGVFVETQLDDPDAASEEIIHAERPPFFF